MILKLVIHFIILVIWAVHVQVSAQDYPSISKPGCDSRCGDLPIPFPFGMKGSECYAGKWFEIECRNTSRYQTPYLKSIGVEVISIDVHGGTVTINNPIYRSNCGTKHSSPLNQSLEGSPFVYSQEHNQFVAAGCNIIAFLQLNGSEASGCVSICDEDYKVDDIGEIELTNTYCNGTSCCQTSLPQYLKQYSTEIKGLKENETGHQCSYAMLITLTVMTPILLLHDINVQVRDVPAHTVTITVAIPTLMEVVQPFQPVMGNTANPQVT